MNKTNEQKKTLVKTRCKKLCQMQIALVYLNPIKDPLNQPCPKK
jgi:hypothetical protein